MNANQVRKTLEKEKRNKNKKNKKNKNKRKMEEDSMNAVATPTPLNSLIDAEENTPSYQIVQEEHRDQGLSRTKVLVVLPTRSSAERYVNSIIECLPKSVKQIHNRKRFELEYGLPEMAEYDDDDTSTDVQEYKRNRARREKEILQAREHTRDGRRRSEDWIDLFARNDNDCFTLGMAFSRKEVKMYSDFGSSDIIVASPLGLRMAMGAEGEDEKGKRIDHDFLASIEVLLVDQMEALEMQNWDHVLQLMSYMNQTPKNEAAQTIDFSRVRELDLLNLGKYFRQTIFISAHKMPEITAMSKRSCFNKGGIVKVTRSKYLQGSITAVVPQVRQLFKRIACQSLVSSDDQRFQFFVKHMFPKLKRICNGLDAEKETMFAAEKEQGTILFVPSYFDFLRIKNLFLEEGLRPALCSEYTEPKQQTRNRSSFFHGDQRLLIYTERNHFYHRFRIRGARHIIFYAPPQHKLVYPDMLNVLSTNGTQSTDDASTSSSSSSSMADPSVTCLFTKFDALRLERIVGTSKTKRMIKGKGGKSTYLFL
jgi:U3 small nucleolar RNA-associated protein 25